MATSAARGSGTPATTGTTWATATNAVDGAVGSNPATYATLTSTVSAAVATIEVTGYGFSASIAATATLNSVTISLRHFENNTGRFASVTFQAFDGSTAIGSPTTCTLATAARNDTATPAVTLAQIRSSTFKVRVTITGAASTQSRVESIDYIDVTADYTPLVPKTGSGTGTDNWVVDAVGAAPPPPLPAGSRALETAAARNTEDVVARVLESFVLAVPNTGTGTVSYVEAMTATGAKTQRGAATTTYTEATSAAGKKAPKGALTTAYVETVAAAGRKAPSASATVAHAWSAIAQGVAPSVGVNQGSGLVTYVEATTAAGKRAPKGVSTTTYTETVTAVGKRTPKGAVTTTYSETLAASGKRIQKGTSTTAYLAALGAAGKRTPKATVVTAHAWNTIAQGVKPAVGVKQGSGLVMFTEVPVASGKRVMKGTAATSVLWLPSAVGKRVPKGARIITNTWVLQASGTAPVLLIGYLTVGMQWGSEPVVAWEMNGEGAPV